MDTTTPSLTMEQMQRLKQIMSDNPGITAADATIKLNTPDISQNNPIALLLQQQQQANGGSTNQDGSLNGTMTQQSPYGDESVLGNIQNKATYGANFGNIVAGPIGAVAGGTLGAAEGAVTPIIQSIGQGVGDTNSTMSDLLKDPAFTIEKGLAGIGGKIWKYSRSIW